MGVAYHGRHHQDNHPNKFATSPLRATEKAEDVFTKCYNFDEESQIVKSKGILRRLRRVYLLALECDISRTDVTL